MAKLDLQFEIRHMFYCFIVSITWLVLTFWSDRLFDTIYIDLVPQLANIFIVISYILGFLMFGFSIFVLIEAFEIIN